MPLDFASFDGSDLKFLDGVFSGYCYSNFTFECRRSVQEAFRRRVIIKLVRAPFLIGSLLQRYQVRGIHITRHPCAVVNSLLHAKWDWTFEQVKFRHVFPSTEEVPPNSQTRPRSPDAVRPETGLRTNSRVLGIYRKARC